MRMGDCDGERVERAAAGEDEIADTGDVDNRAVGSGFCELTGEAGDHPRSAVIASGAKQSIAAWIAASLRSSQ